MQKIQKTVLMVALFSVFTAPALADTVVKNGMVSMGRGNVVWVDVVSLMTSDGSAHVAQIECFGWQPSPEDRGEISQRLEKVEGADEAFDAVYGFLTEEVALRELPQSEGEKAAYIVFTGDEWFTRDAFVAMLTPLATITRK